MSDVEQAQRAAVVAEAHTWLRTPYHHMGRINGAGVDCAMLLIEVYSRCGVFPNFDPGYYPPDWHYHRDEEKYLGFVQKLAREVEKPQPADIALYQFGKVMSHGAIVIDWPLIIHAHIGKGCSLDHGDQDWLVRNERPEAKVSFWSPWPAR